MSRHLALGTLLLAMQVVGCGAVAVSTDHTGRSVCAGSIAMGIGTMPAEAENAMSTLQKAYENDPGFLAVIWDDREPVVIVDGTTLQAWQARLVPKGVAVAGSCIDARLLALVMTALPVISGRMPAGGTIGASYDAVRDAIDVDGVPEDVLLQELEELQPGARSTAQLAVANGTLRISAP